MIRELWPAETELAHAAMVELRPAFEGQGARFVAQVNELQRPQGYRLFAAFDVAGSDEPAAVAVAGFRRVVSLAWGDVLYLDDLSTRATTGTTPTGCTSAPATRSARTTS